MLIGLQTAVRWELWISIVGSQDGIKPREVLLRPENVDVWFAGQGQGDLGQG